MRRGLVIWILLMIAALILYFFSNETVTLALLLAVIVAPLISYLLLKQSAGKLEASMGDAEPNGEKACFTVKIKNNGWLPVGSVRTEIKCENLRTGENDLYVAERSLMPHKSAKVKVEIAPTHAGKYDISISQCSVSDPLGIWDKPVTRSGHGMLTSLPEIYEMHVRPVSTAAMPESDLSSVRRKGSVAGDTVGIKEYVAGDPIRNIHWKLSEKVDKLLVRELGEPVTDNYLLLLDSAAGIMHDPEGLDAVASVFASLMYSLRMSELAFNVGWTDPATNKPVIRSIVTDDDYREALDSFLSVPASAPSAFSRIERTISENRYARVIIVGPKIPENIEALTNGCEATILMYEGSESLSTVGVTVTGFDAKTYKQSLSVIEL